MFSGRRLTFWHWPLQRPNLLAILLRGQLNRPVLRSVKGRLIVTFLVYMDWNPGPEGLRDIALPTMSTGDFSDILNF